MRVESCYVRSRTSRVAAAVCAALISAPSMAQAGKPPHPPAPPPPPPPAVGAPAAEPLNLDPSVHWFASWDQKTDPPAADFIVTPSSVGGVAFAQTQYNASATSSPARPLGMLVESQLSAVEAAALFNAQYPQPSGTKAISYVFADFEGPDRLNQTSNLVSQVRNSSWSRKAYVGNFDLTPVGEDSTRRGPAPYTAAQYAASGVNMANTALYPGSSTFRNASTNDWANSNIRTGLFVGPISRFTATQDALDSSYGGTDTLGIALNKHKHIPWVVRFNNWGNSSLDSDGNAANGYQFVPAVQAPNQMVGRGDFSAQVMHYRMRGAYSVSLFAINGPNGGGVVGYDADAARQDVRDGWYGASDPVVAHADAIFAQPDNQRVTMTTNPIIDGTPSAGNRSEETGTIWSGVYSLNMSNPNSSSGKGAMDILASNLDTADHLIKFGSGDTLFDIFLEKNANGYTYADNSVSENSRNYLIEAGMHRMLQFDLVTTRVYNNSSYTGKFKNQTVWLLNQDYVVFNNNNRNDVGIPEPTTFGLIVTASLAGLCRRHRRPKQPQQA